MRVFARGDVWAVWADMRIAMMSQWYDPERGAAMTAGTIARALGARDNDVQVVTGFPNYPDGVVYPGYKMRAYQREELEGITVHRSPLYMSHDTNARRRAANYLSFAASASAVAATRLGKVDVALVHSTPATVAIPAMTRRLLRRTPYVVHIQDLWPETVTASGFLAEGGHRRVENMLHRFCDSVYRHAASIAVTSPGMADRILARGVPSQKISLVPNWADERRFHPATPSKAVIDAIGPRFPFTVMYAGSMGDVQALETLVDAATILREHLNIGFLLVGGGVAEHALKHRAREAGLRNLRFVARQPVDRMAEVLALGDVQVISLRDLPVFRATLPSKVQATLAAGRPIICAVDGDAARVVRESGGGIVTAPESAAEIAEAILAVANMSRDERLAMGDRGRLYYQNGLSEERGAEALDELLHEAAHRRART